MSEEQTRRFTVRVKPCLVKALVAGEENDADLWIADTGATHRMTKSKDFFMLYTAFQEPKPVTLGKRKLMLAYGKGNIQVETLVDNKCCKCGVSV